MMTRRQFYVALALVLVMLVAGGCGGGGAVPAVDWVVDTWDATQISMSIGGPRDSFEQMMGVVTWMRFNANGTYRAEAHPVDQGSDLIELGTWEREGLDAYVLYPNTGGTEVLYHDGSQLCFPVDSELGYVYVWFDRR